MEALNWLIDGTSVSGLAVYCAGMTLLLGTLAWADRSTDAKYDRQQCAGRERGVALIDECKDGPPFPWPAEYRTTGRNSNSAYFCRRRAEHR